MQQGDDADLAGADVDVAQSKVNFFLEGVLIIIQTYSVIIFMWCAVAGPAWGTRLVATKRHPCRCYCVAIEAQARGRPAPELGSGGRSAGGRGSGPCDAQGAERSQSQRGLAGQREYATAHWRVFRRGVASEHHCRQLSVHSITLRPPHFYRFQIYSSQRTATYVLQRGGGMRQWGWGRSQGRGRLCSIE